MEQTFLRRFGASPQVIADAPGRVNLIGEHTDYNGGHVLPLTIPLRTTVALSRGGGDRAQVVSDNLAEEAGFSLDDLHPRGSFVDYVQGVVWALKGAGHQVGGFQALIRSTVPLGAGLSSSAALTVSLLRALRQAFSLRIDDQDLALLAQRAEAGFVGAPVGIMDQMAASLGRPGEALLLHTATMAYSHVPLPRGVEIAVIDSGVSHSHRSGGYKTRRAECEEAAALLGVPLLCDLDLSALPRAQALPPPLAARARHVLTEDHRVMDAVAAMRAGDLASLGGLLYQSHASLRDDFAVSLPVLDALVARAEAEPAVLGARLCGGGFGGAVILLARAGQGRAAAERVAADCAGASQPAVLLPVADKPGT